ncbi:MAG TPA: SDR family NAD(P)-dependent oxidoreductase [Ilumatobacteraceae bacterium]|nr:SDR family NAD(P)-dependent oxidoreductase [Ilumatobacteraceae bacterium]
MADLVDLKGHVAVVTGGGQGVGREIVLHLAAHGAGGVAILDYFADRAEAVAKEVEALGCRALPVGCDVTSYPAVQAAFAKVGDDLGPVDILVNNAGNSGTASEVGDPRSFWLTDPSDWEPWLAVNLYGVMHCTRAALPLMVERAYGRIVTITSDAGRVGQANLVHYSAGKAGAAGFMRAIARAVGRYSITANCVSLGVMRTPAGEAGWLSDPEEVRKVLSRYVLRRVGEPADAANMVVFLASDAASWITGQTIPVNGGYAFST